MNGMKRVNNHTCTQQDMINICSLYCRLSITFANGLDPDQDRNYVGYGSKPFSILIVILKYLFLNLSFDKIQQMTKEFERLPSLKCFQFTKNFSEILRHLTGLNQYKAMRKKVSCSSTQHSTQGRIHILVIIMTELLL